MHTSVDKDDEQEQLSQKAMDISAPLVQTSRAYQTNQPLRPGRKLGINVQKS